MRYQINNTLLTPFEQKHMTEKYRNWMHDPEVTQFNSWGLFAYTKQQQQQFLKEIEEGTDTKIVWAIEAKTPYIKKIAGPSTTPMCVTEWNPVTHIGNCSLQRIDYINRSAEFAIVIGEKRFWGQGIGTDVLNKILYHAFMKLGLNRVWTGTAVTNRGMCNAAERNNMQHEGVFEEGVFLNGKFVDVNMYGILQRNWASLNLSELEGK